MFMESMMMRSMAGMDFRWVGGLSLAVLVCGVGTLGAQMATDQAIVKQIEGLRALPDANRGEQTGMIAKEIRTLPAGIRKVQLANGLAHLATEGDPGRENLQEVTTTLGSALAETPAPAGKDGKPASAYVEVAELVRYEGMTTELSDPMPGGGGEGTGGPGCGDRESGFYAEGYAWQEGDAERVAREDRDGELLGDVVPAVPS
jgi:hypothetical protein